MRALHCRSLFLADHICGLYSQHARPSSIMGQSVSLVTDELLDKGGGGEKPQRDPQWRRIASACRSRTLFARLSAMKVRSHWNLLNICIVQSLGLGTVPIQMPNNFGKDLRIGQAIRAIYCTHNHGYFGNWWKCLRRHAPGKTCYVSTDGLFSVEKRFNFQSSA